MPRRAAVTSENSNGTDRNDIATIRGGRDASMALGELAALCGMTKPQMLIEVIKHYYECQIRSDGFLEMWRSRKSTLGETIAALSSSDTDSQEEDPSE